ncbi:MAG TPA: hypothetical protein VH600_06875 [Burkholderiales bacterium]|jgi:hypothetical protein
MAAVLIGTIADASAQAGRKAANAEAVEGERESPWLLVPVLSVDPKLGTSLGAMAGYMHHFDEKSRLSMLAASAQWTSTGSAIAGLFGTGSWAQDQHRLVAGLAGGKIKNDYDDYLGTGVPLRSDSDLSMVIARYLYRLKNDWFGGAQFINANFSMTGQDPFDQQVLDVLGMKGFTSGGVGLVAYHDSRDVETMPTRGWVLNLNNLAFRSAFGGDQDFDTYRADYKGFWSHGAGHVLAVRQYNQWTVDAPPEALASVRLRGYKQGQYLGKYMSSIEAEERHRWSERWTSTFFVGIACLYGAEKDCFDRESAYPNIGAGVQYVIKRKEGIVANLEFATGKDGNYGVYMKMGYSY